MSVVSAPAEASGYQYRSHFDEANSTQTPVIATPIQAAVAVKFARTMARVRRNDATPEATALFEQHPLLHAYAKLSAELKATHARNRGSASASGLIKHLGQLMNWPVTGEQWDEARRLGQVLPQSRMKRERARSNTELGKRADQEITAVINDFVSPLAKSLHRYTKWFFMYLYQRQWMPLDAQLPLWSEDNATVFTWADVVCYDLTRPGGALVLIELKTGYTYRYFQPLTANPYATIVHTPYNQHQMQLGWMQWRLASLAATKGIEVVDGYVLRVNSVEGVPSPYALDEQPRQYFATVYKQLNSREDEQQSLSTPQPSSDDVPELLGLVSKKNKRSRSADKKGKKRRMFE